MSDIATTRHSDSIIEIAIDNRTASSWQLAEGDPIPFFLVHVLGAPGRPLFSIKRRKAPDNPWAIEVLDGDLVSPAKSCPDELIGLVGAEHQDDLGGLLAVLPAGEYLVVRAGAETEPRPGVLLGNDWVSEPPEHLETLARVDDMYALAAGPGAAPDRSRPLLGIAALNYTGSWRPLTALFFDVLAAPAPEPGLDTPVVIIPRSGPLVFDGEAHVVGHDSAADKKRWRERDALEYAKVLAG